ncbi:hypothetical protein A3Q56_00680 [Intoshia linei]|uniref:Uncharacterized protein n=1 Tax=Intoshia linei TaxID=1819745 RepID=A0A177BB77_9BILA|nr:hypothetical protein A3Q56_00680 [Intoshia linei]
MIEAPKLVRKTISESDNYEKLPEIYDVYEEDYNQRNERINSFHETLPEMENEYVKDYKDEIRSYSSVNEILPEINNVHQDYIDKSENQSDDFSSEIENVYCKNEEMKNKNNDSLNKKLPNVDTTRDDENNDSVNEELPKIDNVHEYEQEYYQESEDNEKNENNQPDPTLYSTLDDNIDEIKKCKNFEKPPSSIESSRYSIETLESMENELSILPK